MIWSRIQAFPLTWLWFLVVFLVSGIIVNLLQLLLLPLWLISTKHFRWINSRVVYLHWSYLTFLIEWWCGTNIVFYGKQEDIDMMGKESAIVLPNHRSDVDWLLGWAMAERANILGATKCYMKGYLKFVPLLGWAWWCCEYIFLKRSWDHDEYIIKKFLEKLGGFPIPFWVVIFAEGTRLTKEKHKVSMEHAEAKGIPVLKHHLLPRTKGFVVTAKYLKDKVPAVYDFQLIFTDECPTLQNLLNAQGSSPHILVRRIPFSEIPSDTPEQLSDWCHKLFREKDAHMEYFIQHGTFPFPVASLPRTRKNLLITIAWHLVVGIPVLVYTVQSIVQGSIALLGPILGLIVFGWVSMQVFYFVTDTKRSSSFGLSNNSAKKTS